MSSLFTQTKDLEGPLGPRLNGKPEVLNEVKYYCGFMVSFGQIQIVLESVPEIFPEDWESPDAAKDLDKKQAEIYNKITDAAATGPRNLTGPQIQQIIKLGLYYRNQYK